MIGRHRQLESLSERALAAARGEGSFVLVEGDAGAGKTRLIAEFCTALPKGTLRYVDGRALEYARQPFGPIVAACRALLRVDPTLAPSSAIERRAIAKLLPELSEPEQALSNEGESDKLQQFEALAGIFYRGAASLPTVVIIEDIHWADQATLEFLQHIARDVGRHGLCIISTCRSEELIRGHPVWPAIARLQRGSSFWHVVLDPLSEEEMTALISEALGERHRLAPEIVSAIGRQAEGNPLFAEELLRSTLDRTQHAVRDLPRSLAEAVTQRLAQLSAHDRNTVVTAAAIGHRFTPEFLAEITQAPLGDVASALKRSIDLQLVIQTDDRGGLEFRHALTRKAIYGELLSAEAKPLHEKIAGALEAKPDAERFLQELAYQWWAGGVKHKAALYNERAGDAAEAVFSPHDAIECFTRALEATEEDDERRATLWRKLGLALYRAGLGSRAQDALETAVRGFLKKDKTDQAAETLIELAHLRWTLADMPGHQKATQQALDLIGDRLDSPVWFAARVQMAWSYAFGRSNLDQALSLLADAQRSSAHVRPWDRVKLHECRALSYIMQGRESQALAEATIATDAALAAADPANAARCWGNVGIDAAQCGERRIAETAFKHALDLIGQQRRFGWVTPWVLALFAHAALLYGKLDEAEKAINRALASVMDVPTLDLLVAWTGIPLGLAIGNNELVERCADEALVSHAFESVGDPFIADMASAFAAYYVARDRADDARRLLGRALSTIKSFPTPGDYGPMLMLVAQHCERATVQRAKRTLDQMDSVKLKPIAAYRAAVEAWDEKRFGDPARARASAQDAANLFEALEWPLHRARLLELAERPQEAAAIYKSVGARADAQRVEDALSPPNRRGRRRNELSERETEIAALIVRGLSNKQIAEKLILSERTVESHVSSIFAKLNVTSRRDVSQHLKASKQTAAKEA